MEVLPVKPGSRWRDDRQLLVYASRFGPPHVVFVDDVLVLMLQCLMLMGVPVGLRPLPSFVLMLVVFVMDMKMGVAHRHVAMLEMRRVGRWPKNPRQTDRNDRNGPPTQRTSRRAL